MFIYWRLPIAQTAWGSMAFTLVLRLPPRRRLRFLSPDAAPGSALAAGEDLAWLSASASADPTSGLASSLGSGPAMTCARSCCAALKRRSSHASARPLMISPQHFQGYFTASLLTEVANVIFFEISPPACIVSLCCPAFLPGLLSTQASKTTILICEAKQGPALRVQGADTRMRRKWP